MHTRYLLLAALISFPALAERPQLTENQIRHASDRAARNSATMTPETAAFWHAIGIRTIEVELEQSYRDEDERRRECERLKRKDPRARC